MRWHGLKIYVFFGRNSFSTKVQVPLVKTLKVIQRSNLEDDIFGAWCISCKNKIEGTPILKLDRLEKLRKVESI